MNFEERLRRLERITKDLNKQMCCVQNAEPEPTTFVAPRVQTIDSIDILIPDVSSYDGIVITDLAEALTIDAPTGTPVELQPLYLRILDNGVARAITWDAIYRAMAVTLPTTTVAGDYLYVGIIYNAVDLVWDVINIINE